VRERMIRSDETADGLPFKRKAAFAVPVRAPPSQRKVLASIEVNTESASPAAAAATLTVVEVFGVLYTKRNNQKVRQLRSGKLAEISETTAITNGKLATCSVSSGRNVRTKCLPMEFC
jgi:hypothetical protein